MKSKKIFPAVVLTCILGVQGGFITYGQDGKDQPTDYLTSDTIYVYYFHFTHRCATCLALEDETKTVLQQVYPEQLASGIIRFGVFNIEKKSSKPFAKKAGVNTQALIIMQNGKRFDLTRDGFLYVMTRPDKLDKKIREVIENFLYQ